MKILMVCLGNICRSPLAEGILQHKVNQQIKLANKKFENWEIDSAGTSEYHNGKLPDERSILVAKDNQIDITMQRSRQFTAQDFNDFDIIYVMDSSNFQNVLALAQSEEDKNKVKLIMDELGPGKNIQVPDPYYDAQNSRNGFDNVFEMLDNACEVIINKY